MTEEKNTKIMEENPPSIKETAGVTEATIPPAGGNITPVNNTPENNSLAVQEENYPVAQNTSEKTLNVEQAKDLTIAELKSKQYQGTLTADEAKRLKKYEAENNGEGKLSQENKKNHPYREIKPHKLEEGDIIEVMYKGLLNDAMNVDAWFRKHFWHAYDKMLDKHKIDNNKNDSQDNSQNNTSKTSQDETFDLDAEYAKKYEAIKNQKEKDLSNTEKISQAIKKGTLFDKENKDLLSEFENITQNDDKQGKKTFDAVKQACEDKSKSGMFSFLSKDKKAEKQDNQEAREKMAAEFFAYNAGAVILNFANRHAAVNMAYAEVSHRSKHENMNAKQMEREFNTANDSYYDNIKKSTAQEQQAAKEKISQSTLIDKKVLSKDTLDDLYDTCAPKTRSMKGMGEKAVEYAHLNSNITERNPYVSGVRHMVGMPKLPEKDNVFSGSTLMDAVNYMKNLRHDTLQTTSINDYNAYLREQTSNHINRLKNAQSNEEILKQLRDRNNGR